MSGGTCLYVHTAAERRALGGRPRGDLDPFNIPRVQHLVETIRGPSRYKNLTHASILTEQGQDPVKSAFSMTYLSYFKQSCVLQMYPDSLV